jgi:hypothetical protein
MAISVTRADVKRKLMIATADTSYDSAIDSLISEMQPAIEYRVDPSYLADTENAGLQATLKLGMLEIICGEFLEQTRRETGACEEFTIAGLTVGARQERGTALTQQGYDRLTPYARSTAQDSTDALIASSTSQSDRALPSDSGIW